MVQNKSLVKCFALVLFLAAVSIAAIQVGTAPQAAFANLANVDCSQNQDFCSGYVAGELQPIPMPLAPDFPDWWTYIAAVRKMELPRTRSFFPINHNVGYDCAMEDAAAWEWVNNPQSCGKVVCQ